MSSASYVPLGLETLTYQSGDGHTDTDGYVYDASTGRMKSYTFAVDGYAGTGTPNWLANGELGGFSVSDSIPGTADNGFSCTYDHDDLGRLSSSNCGASSYQNFTFDPFGGVCKTATAGTNFCPAYNLDNQITTISYDNDGDALSDPVSGAANAFDAEGRSTTFLGGAVLYDALGRAVEAGGHELVYGPGGGKLAVMSGQTLVRADIPLPGGAEAVFNVSGFAWYRHADWLGSSRLATTYAGAVYSSEAFAPFGEPLLEAGTHDRSFTGMKQDLANGSTGDGNGQYDFLAREYSPTQSRWWTPDPASLAAANPANPQSWNRYAYVDGMPMANTDPTGLVCQPEQVNQDCEPGFSQGAGGYGGGGGYGGDSAGGGEFGLMSVPAESTSFGWSHDAITTGLYLQSNLRGVAWVASNLTITQQWQLGWSTVQVGSGLNLLPEVEAFGVQTPDLGVPGANQITPGPSSGATLSAPLTPGVHASCGGILAMGALQTGLDAVGAIPAAGEVFDIVRFAGGLGSTAMSIDNADGGGATIGGTGIGVDFAGKDAALVEETGGLIPVVGRIVSGAAAGLDLWSTIRTYGACRGW